MSVCSSLLITWPTTPSVSLSRFHQMPEEWGGRFLIRFVYLFVYMSVHVCLFVFTYFLADDTIRCRKNVGGRFLIRFVCLFVCLYVCAFVYLPTCLHFCTYVSLSLSDYLSVPPLSVCLSECISVCQKAKTNGFIFQIQSGQTSSESERRAGLLHHRGLLYRLVILNLRGL
jgi:hypothetical protein